MKDFFKNKIVMVTGASSGIGRATSLAFAQRGAVVVLADIQQNKELISQVCSFSNQSSYIKCDVTNEDDVKQLVEYCIKKYGTIDVAFNNAGIEGPSCLTEHIKTDEWDFLMDINLKGIWFCLKYQLPIMKKNKDSAIVNCSSVAGIKGFPNAAAYVASKHALIGLTKTAAIEAASSGLRINCICPGVIETPMIERTIKNSADIRKNYEQMAAFKRLGRPEEIASGVLFLCSEESSFMTGQTLVVDGGLLIK